MPCQILRHLNWVKPKVDGGKRRRCRGTVEDVGNVLRENLTARADAVGGLTDSVSEPAQTIAVTGPELSQSRSVRPGEAGF